MEGYSGKMFGRENSRAYFLYLNFNCCLKRLLHQRSGGRKKLNKPFRDNQVLAFNPRPTLSEISKHKLRAH